MKQRFMLEWAGIEIFCQCLSDDRKHRHHALLVALAGYHQAPTLGSFNVTLLGDAADKLASAFKSLQVLWNSAYLLLYFGIVIYLVRTQPVACGNTAIACTSGIVSVIFSGHVLACHMDKRLSPPAASPAGMRRSGPRT